MNAETTIAAIIPTPGQGRPLKRCLLSIRPQLEAGDEVLVVGDTHAGALRDVAALVQDFGPPFRYLPHDAGRHAWGHPQLNHGMAQARAAWLTFNDDDDVYAPGAFGLIRAVAASLPAPRPLLFKFRSYWGYDYWSEGCRRPHGALVATEDHIGGHCIVAPNLPDRLGAWSDRYQGDFDFIRSTLDLWPGRDGAAVWRDEVIAIARPGETGVRP